MASVTFRRVSKRYGTTTVIDGLDLAVQDREFLVLVGPSGCGKSTALRMIAGLEEVTEGTISIGERVVNDLAPKDRDIAMVFQSYALYPHMTVRQNLAFGLEMRKVARREVEDAVSGAAELLGISALLERKPRQLSGGQRQRVALGRAIVRKPSVFLFDEPLSNLDAKLRVQMRAEIRRLQERLKTTAVYVTHDQVEAMTMGHRIAVMNRGRIEQVGTPLDLYARPETLFVANFIGTPPMNFLRGSLSPDGSVLEAGSVSLHLPASLRSATAGSKGRLVAGIRPEDVREAGPTRGEAAPVTVEVELLEPLGHENVVHGRIGEDLLVAKLPAQRIPAIGSKLDLVLELDALHLFDAETERRLVA